MKKTMQVINQLTFKGFVYGEDTRKSDNFGQGLKDSEKFCRMNSLDK